MNHIDLNNKNRKLLASYDFSGNLKVFEDEHFRWMETKDGIVQSAVNLESTAEIVSPVMKALTAALAMCDRPKDILNLGMGGATIERALYDSYPESQVTSVEKSSRMRNIAIEFFFLPDTHPVIITSAHRYLRSCSLAFDVVFCDVFDDDKMPPCMHDAFFFDDVSRCLNSDGIFSCNLSSVDKDELLATLVALRTAFRWSALYDVPGYDNAILFASRRQPRTWGELSDQLAITGLRLGIDLSEISDGLTVLPQPRP